MAIHALCMLILFGAVKVIIHIHIHIHIYIHMRMRMSSYVKHKK